VTVSEGATTLGGEIVEHGEIDAYGHRKLGGIGELIADEIKRLTGHETMYQKLGYLMRSGPPDSLDRMVSLCFGTLAFQMIKNNETGKMVAIQDGKYTTFPLDKVTSGKRVVDVDAYYDKEKYQVRIHRVLGVPMFLS